jgi:soluble lytic murein transglycosylase
VIHIVYVGLLAAQVAQAPSSPPVDSGPASPPSVPADSAVSAATNALARGLPWRATLLLAPVLSDSTRRTSEAVLLAATAASRWGGWEEVQRLLSPESWADSAFGGEGCLLLARAALERRQDSLAAANAARAIALLDDSERRGTAFVYLAEVLERLGSRDSAAKSYARAAELLPGVADWLWLRAAGVTTDSAGRATAYAALRRPATRVRVPFTEAVIREHIGDYLGAAQRYDLLGARTTALRLRLAAANDSAGRDSMRRELVAFVDARPSVGDAQRAIAILDSAFTGLGPGDELIVARAAAASGLPPRAVAGYTRALEAGIGDAEDRFEFATALGRVGRYRESAKEFERVPAGHRQGGAAAYQRGRALLRDGQEESATKALRLVLRRFPRDTAAATPALLLLADLAIDARHDADARKLLARLAAQFPKSRFTPSARFQAALIALLEGGAETAAKEFDALAASRNAGDEVPAATYWSGRAWAQTGDSARARGRWSTLAARDPTSYYAGLSEERLGLSRWLPPAAADSFVPVPEVDSAMARGDLLVRIGLSQEAAWEHEDIARQADQSVDRLLATANAFRERDLGSPAIRLARRAIARGAAGDARTYRLLYPIVRPDAILAQATVQSLDPSFVAALIRQESMFNPGATSSVGARGLMQVMPDLGRILAKALSFPAWDPALLYQPDVSLELGTRHLAELVHRYDDPARTLAAYNAGVSRVDRWMNREGVADAEIFVERIPFIETRDYVRLILRSRDLYRGLYAWMASSEPRS